LTHLADVDVCSVSRFYFRVALVSPTWFWLVTYVSRPGKAQRVDQRGGRLRYSVFQ